MATVFTHPLIALAITPWFGTIRHFKSVLVIGLILTILPDIDIVGLRLGIPYSHLFGHRGFSHSLFFAINISLFVSLIFYKYYGEKIVSVWLFLFLCTLSHGLLDALTNGGLGIAFFSPFTNERYFFPFQPIEVSTLNIKSFFAGQGLEVLKSEIIWIWIPALLVFLFGLYRIKAAVKH